MAGWWLRGAVRCGAARLVCVAGVCMCRLACWVGLVSAGLRPLGASALVACPLGVLAPRGVTCFVVSWSPWVCWVPSCSVLLPPCRPRSWVSRPCHLSPPVPVPLRLCCCGRVVAWRLGCSGGLRGVLGGSLSGCSPFSPCGYTLPALCGARWSVGATWCGSCGVWSELRRQVLVGVQLWGSRSADLVGGGGGAGPSGEACPSFVSLPAPVSAPSPPVPRLLALPFPGPPMVPCPSCCIAAGALSLSAPACYLGPLLALLPRAFPLPFPFPICWWWGTGGGAVGRRLAHARGWVVWSHWPRVSGVQGGRRPWTASRRRAFHAACGMAASGAVSLGLAGVRVRISSRLWIMCTPSRLPAPPAYFTKRRSSRRAGGDHQARCAGAGGWGRAPSLRSWSRGCGSSRWRMRIGGAGNGKHGAVRGGRGRWTWDGAGVRDCAQGSGNSGTGELGGHGGASGSRSGTSERLRRLALRGA